MIHVIHMNIAAHPFIGLRATSNHILICKVREIFLFTLDPYQFHPKLTKSPARYLQDASLNSRRVDT